MMRPLVPHMLVVLSEKVHKITLQFKLILTSVYVNILLIFAVLIKLKYVIKPASVYCQYELGACSILHQKKHDNQSYSSLLELLLRVLMI